jgi:purine-binding chemotaxis protein CheW
MTGESTRDELAELIAATDLDRESRDGTEGAAATVPLAAMILFRAGERWYGVAAEQVREVVTRERIARVPALPAHILGVALVHSRLVPVIDLPTMLGRTADSAAENARLIVLEAADAEVSLVADEARGVVELAVPAGGARAEFVRGEVSWNDELVCILDGPALVERATAEAQE